MIIMITYTRLVPNSVVDSPPVAFSTFNKTKTKRFHRQQSDHSRRELEQFWDLIHRRGIRDNALPYNFQYLCRGGRK